MNNIKNNPIKYVKLFALLYVAVSIVSRLFYYISMAVVYSQSVVPSTIFGFLLSYVPVVLLLIYSFKFYGTNKSHILLTVSYIVSIVLSFIGVINNIKSIRYIYYYSSIAQAIRYGALETLLNIVFSIVALVFTVILLCTCLNNFKTLKIAKKIVIINAGLSVVSILFGLILDFIFGAVFHIMFFASLLMTASSLLSHAAYIIFWNFAIDKRTTSPLEYELLSLKELYENGSISEQEYNEKKAVVLNKF